MLTPHDILFGIILPAVIAIVAMLLSHLPPWKREAQTLPFGPAVAIAGGFVVAFAGIAGWPELPPIGFEGWLVYLAIASAVVGVIATIAITAGRMMPKRMSWGVSMDIFNLRFAICD